MLTGSIGTRRPADSAAAPTTGARRGWCPSPWTPMASGDGLIVRVSAGIRPLRAEQLRALTRLARAYGNGLVELTRRANLQLRGIRPESVPALQGALLALGLAEPAAWHESRLALLVNPLAGLDPTCAPLAAMAARLESMLQAHAQAEQTAPAKLGLLLDGGGTWLRDVAADIRIELRVDNPALAYLSLGGTGASALPLGACHVDDAPEAALRLIGVLARSGQRMRDWLAAQPSAADAAREVVGALLIVAAGPDERALAASAAQPSAAPAAAADTVGDSLGAPAPMAGGTPSSVSPIGFHTGLRSWFGLAIAFGSGDAAQWDAIAELAERFGSGEIRPTPGRALLLPDVSEADSPLLVAAARSAGLITDPGDPLLRVVACAGAPACASAWGETRDLARQLSQLLMPLSAANATLHVSGCSKSCALSGAADLTLVHAADGCRVGLRASAAELASNPALTLAAAIERLRDFTLTSTGRTPR